MLAILLLPLRAGAADANEAAADAVLAALRDGDAARLTTLAQASAPDPWRVAAVLADRGAHDAALALARATDPRTGRDALVRYVLARQAGGTDGVRELSALLMREAGQRDAGQETERAATLRQASDLVTALGWIRMQPYLDYQAGDAARRCGDFDGAALCWERWLTAAGAQGDGIQRTQALINLGALEAMFGGYDAALRRFAKALELMPGTDRAEDRVILLGNMARIHELRGRYREAMRLLEGALDGLPADSPLRAEVLLQLGGVHFQLGGHPRAQSLIRQAQVRFEAAGDRAGAARCLGQLSALCAGLRDYEEASRTARAAVELFEQTEEPSPAEQEYLISGLTNQGIACTQLGQHREALALQKRALALAKEHGDPGLLASVESNLAFAYLRSNELEKAFDLYTEVERFGRDTDSAAQRLVGAQGRARVLHAQSRDREALFEIRKALDEVTVLTEGLGVGQGAEARARHAEVSSLATRIAGALGDPAAMWEALERGRANALLESLSSRSEIRSAVIDPELAAELDRLREEERRAGVRLDLARTTGGGDRKLARRRAGELSAVREELDDTLRRAERAAKRIGGILRPRIVGLARMQQSLGPGQTLIEYALLEKEALALVVSASAARIVSLGPAEPIRSAVDAADFSRQDATLATAGLRSLLLDPLEVAPEERLLISPDGVLFRLPFAALAPEREIAYVPSGSTLFMLREERVPVGRGVLGIGAPHYEKRRELLPLPSTEKEIRSVADVCLLGADATASGVAKQVARRARWRAIHFACHGTFDAEAPMYSGLELSDRRLTIADLFATPLPADLVVLSACDTGRGAFYPGEGLVGLTRAIMFAGSQTVIASLWKVDDGATAALMSRFYEIWNSPEGSRRGACYALREAQAYLRSIPRFQHPAFWAAWVLWGLPE